MQVIEKDIVNYEALLIYDVMKFVEEAVRNGYSVPPLDDIETFPRTISGTRAIVYMVKPDNVASPDEYEYLEKLTKKDDLLRFAFNLKIDVPSNVDRPLGIKKYIREALLAREQAETIEAPTTGVESDEDAVVEESTDGDAGDIGETGDAAGGSNSPGWDFA